MGQLLAAVRLAPLRLSAEPGRKRDEQPDVPDVPISAPITARRPPAKPETLLDARTCVADDERHDATDDGGGWPRQAVLAVAERQWEGKAIG